MQTADKDPKTIGEHLKKHRLQRRLLQNQVAKLLGVNRGSVQNWELGIYEPSDIFVAKIVSFLGYDPRNQVSMR